MTEKMEKKGVFCAIPGGRCVMGFSAKAIDALMKP